MTKYIKVHDVKGGEAIINTDKITIIAPEKDKDGGAFIVFDSPAHFHRTKEPLSEIENMLRSDDMHEEQKLRDLIHCKDCENLSISGALEHMNGDTTFFYICDHWHRAVDEWGFCNYAERKEADG